MDHRLNSTYWALRIAFGATAFLAGLDKFFNLLTNWEQYVSPLLTGILPVSASFLMHVVGVIEMAAGIIVLSGMTRIGAYIVSAWLVAIAVSLLTTGRYFDIAVRDLVLAIGAYTLAQLAEVREESGAHAASLETRLA